MKLENQVCSLEHAKRLKELGVKQESLWWWTRLDDSKDFILMSVVNSCAPRIHEGISAFTVAELGEMLPMSKVDSCKPNKVWVVDYNILTKTCKADTEANARAKMLIWLLERGKKKT